MKTKEILITLLLFIASMACGLAHPSVSLVMDSKGNVYYSDLKQVWKIDTKGNKSIVVHNVHSHELYLDEADNLYGEHLWYNGETVNTWGYYVWQLRQGGKLEKTVASGDVLNNYSLVRDKHGNMYSANRENTCQKVTRKNKDGTLTSLGDACMGNIRWMTVSSEGTVYLVDFHDIKKIDTHGLITTLAKNLPDKKISQFFVNDIHYISGISTDKAENVYVADFSGRQVKKVTYRGKVSVIAKTNIPWSPTGILLAPNGDLWILECSITNAVRVERITTDGRRIIY